LSDGVVRLRSPADADAGWIADAVADPEIPRWTRIPSPYTKDDAFAWVALSESMAREGTAYNLVITAVDDGARLGTVGLQVHDETPPHGELGYWIAADARGKGVATRAVRLVAAWALGELGLPLVEIHVLPANTPSHAVARKAGFEPAGQRLLPFRGRVEDFDVYVLKKSGAAVSGRPGL
jgi:RimJ/RimL family protein N-acetyltransferase